MGDRSRLQRTRALTGRIGSNSRSYRGAKAGRRRKRQRGGRRQLDRSWGGGERLTSHTPPPLPLSPPPPLFLSLTRYLSCTHSWTLLGHFEHGGAPAAGLPRIEGERGGRETACNCAGPADRFSIVRARWTHDLPLSLSLSLSCLRDDKLMFLSPLHPRNPLVFVF